MKKYIAMLIMFALLLIPGQVFAHSKLTTSTPANNDILSQSPETISMEFNTDIASLSTFTLENEAGEAVPVNDISVEGHKLFGSPASPLATSSYTVKWTIIGADGHTIKGDFSFKVNATEPTATPEVTATPVTTQPDTPATTSPAINDSIDVEEADTTKNLLFMPIIIAIIIALAVIFVMKSRKK